ncbi:fungal-specific transcription factor domain-containing protein [Penicillium taxi]|uniref:fungal-specific transcription factor domain-containing protein n=1 Tax=Penicillium taxi TaxID=168475 RepID=UPI002545B721|nr:fungal-specific transcription factor domain-containing protein [Penicillium taxi]KAJ5893423.1 fungal-specific transcription factor domain-containing protein [Penicillium taxi]
MVTYTAVLETRLRTQDSPLADIGLDLNRSDGEQPEVAEIQLDLSEDTFSFLSMMSPNNTSSPEALLAGTTSGAVPKLTQAELNQLYFDRVYPFIPILQQGRYFSWAKQRSPSRSHLCLKYAVWTMAASLSSQFQHMRDGLYHDTRQMLESLENEDQHQEDAFYLQQAQTWILLAVYEFIQKTFRRTWASTGRALRLAQLLKLNSIDPLENFNDVSSSLYATDAETEEKRRTFWMMYCLDRLLCILNNSPLTVDEHAITTRLPSSEVDFQSGNPVLAPFLSDVILCATDVSIQNPFSECIIFSTLWGRVLSHQKQYCVKQACGSPITEFWGRHLWLDNLLTQRIQLHQIMPNLDWMDPMLLFTRMIAQAAVLSLRKATQLIAWQAHDYGDMLGHCEQKAENAAREIARLSQYLSQLNFLKIHPFISIPLFLGGEFFIHQKGADIYSARLG